MEKIDLMSIAMRIKGYGYKVAMNGDLCAIFVGNDKNVIRITIDSNHTYYSLICKECFCNLYSIGDEITKENIDRALNSDVWKYKKVNPITIEEWANIVNMNFFYGNRPPYETIRKPIAPEPNIMASDSIKLPNREKARDVLLRNMNEAIKEFEDETGLKVTSISGDIEEIIDENDDVSYGNASWSFTTKL